MQPISTRVESVTLYHRGATVRRVASLDLSSGVPTSVFVAGLPLSLLDHTVRVRVEADSGALVLTNVHLGLHAPPRGTPPEAPERTALTAVHAKLELRHHDVARIEEEMQRLASVPVLPRPAPEDGRLPTASPMSARTALAQLADEGLDKRLTLLRALRDEVVALEREAADLERRLRLASTATDVRPDELTKSVHASVVVPPGAKPSKATLVLEYFVLGARWAPAYQCRMTRDCRQADLQLRAMVVQRSGEDWNGVALNLSTASPLTWTELPELSAIKIGKAQPPPPSKKGFRPPPQGGASLFIDYDRGLAAARAAVPVIPSWQPPALPEASVVAGPPVDLSADLGASESDDEGSMLMREEREVAPMEKSKKQVMPAAPAMASMAAPMKPMAAKSALGGARRMRAEAADDGFGASEAPAALEVVLYASLRLPGPGDGARGRLRPVDRRQAFVESLHTLGLSAPFDVLAVVERAERDGSQVGALPPPSGTIDVRAEAGWYDYVYRTDAAVDVPSDGTFHSVPVNTRTATGDVLYVVVPREDPQVYRQALVRNPLKSPLLPGPVEVYVAGEYVLTTGLPSVAPGGDFKLSLGVEQAIKVARNTTFTERRSGDKVVATNELIHDVVLEVVNNLDREAKCEIRERLPQPAPEAEVVVDEGKVSPPWEAYKQEERGHVIEGGRRWVLTVKPGASQKLSAQYTVKLYANNELVGGNRREV
jgi:Domain of unknown function (DUF4139)/N-terminal domain of unknown function (DUF4140)